jgi:hypothetical protein
MGHRKSERASRKGGTVSLLLLFLLIAALPACRESRRREEPAQPSSAEKALLAVPPRPDPALDRLFRHIAGLPERSGGSWPDEPSWTEFARLADREWTSFDKTVLEPMKNWAGTELREARQSTAALFYPFGGPDFVTAFALCPGARETVLLGLEQVGNLPDLDRATERWREAFFADLGDLVSGFCERGYFITRDMVDIYGRGKVDGALPVVAFFLARSGCSAVSVTRLAPDGKGGWTETPYARLASRPRRPYGARIIYLVPGETEARSVVYFSCDIENKAFPSGSALHRYFAGLERMTTFIKSGSYLLHYNDFSTLRDLVLARSLFVLEDDTGLPYRYFKNGGWEIELFGQYAMPVKDFKNVEQPDLRRAYEEDGPSVAPLPFHFGYHWRTRVDNLLLAQRPHRPYKTPVDR